MKKKHEGTAGGSSFTEQFERNGRIVTRSTISPVTTTATTAPVRACANRKEETTNEDLQNFG